MLEMNRPRWLILISCVYLVIVSGLIFVGLVAPGMQYTALVILYAPILTAILLGFLSEGYLRYSKVSGK